MRFITNYIKLFCFIFFSVSTAYSQCPLDLEEPAVPTTDNLQLYFPFDGTLDNYGNPVYSASLVGATYVPSACGEGLSFDGEDDYVLVSPTLNLTDDYTVTAWINPNNQDDAMGIFSIREQCVTTYRGFSQSQFTIGDYGVTTLNNQLNKHVACTGWSGGDRYTNAGIVIPDLAPTFVALTVENNNTEGRVVKLYVNCEEYETEMTLDLPTDVCFDPAITYLTTIGASSSVAGYTNTFDGTVDEVRVYDDILTHQEILDVYNHCVTLEMDVERFPDCVSDSAEVTLYNTQVNVEYQLFDITNGVFLGTPLAGNCGTLVFNTDLVDDTTEYRIVATHTVSGCETNLDSIITISPIAGEFFATEDVSLCDGDSLLINGVYVFDAGTYSDTVEITPFCDSIITVNVALFTAGDVLFTVSDTIGCYPLTASFEDVSGIAGTTDWLWDFGDGGTSVLESPSHDYTDPGPYDVTLTLTTADGCVVDTSMRILYPATYYMTGSTDITICEGETVFIGGEWISDAGTYIDTIPAGSFCDSIITYNVTVYNDLTVNFSYTDPTGCEPITIDFTDLTTVLTGGESWFWNFDDGSISFEQNPSHTYLTGGTYDVYLRVTTSSGCEYEITQTIVVDATPQPDAAFSFDPSNPEVNDEVQFTDESFNATSWLWSFGDGGHSTDQHPKHTYTGLGNYEVTLIVYNGDCVDTVTQIIFIAEELIFYVPNAFTPDGDEFNDEFFPVFTSGFDPYDYHLTILNRWGEVIFESYNAGKGWDGTYGGTLVQDGVYIWKIEFGDINNDEKYYHTGHVTVLK